MTGVKQASDFSWSSIIVIIIGTFMAVLNNSIVNVALPKIMVIFNCGQDSIQWVLTGYTMTLGVVMPISGYLGDGFGYKKVYSLALGFFTLGSVLCGLSWSVNSMVAARVLQAIGGGIMSPVGMAFVYRVTPREKIGIVMGIYGIAAMAAPAIGPTLGGYLVEYINWRLIFYLNVPIGIINLFLAALLLKETPLIKGKTFDWIGFVSSATGLLCLLLATSQGTKYGWGSTYILSLLITSFTTLLIFVYNELEHPEPLLDLRLFKDFMYSISIVIGAVLNIGLFGALFLMPLFLQNILGQTAMQAGLMMLPSAITIALFMPLAGKLFDRFGARGVVMSGLAICAFTTYKMVGFNDQTPFSLIITWTTLRGIGMGLCMITVTTAGMLKIPMIKISRASALGNVIRQCAGSLGIAMFSTILQNREIFHYASLAQSANLTSGDASGFWSWLSRTAISQGWTTLQVQYVGIGLAAKKLVMLSAVQAIDDCFMVAAAITFLAVLLSFFLGGWPFKRAEEQPVELAME
ncbi:MAG TPA: DHA2 family efflux MFS transporter permease subunit [Syntrophomonadaceae bacterium]|nr:DHA2 family efflux MFS transporter permease subunit [Syntrophomonadaceae bacterium]